MFFIYILNFFLIDFYYLILILCYYIKILLFDVNINEVIFLYFILLFLLFGIGFYLYFF